MRGFRPTAGALLLALTTVSAGAQQPASSANPVCQRLEGQLSAIDRGNTDPARADQIRRAEDAVNKQQFDVDRQVSESRRLGCENSGFFSIFNSPPPQCGQLTRQIGQSRIALERMQVQLEQLSGGTAERAAQRRAVLVSLGDNNCGPQYRQAAVSQGTFLERLFSNDAPGVGGGGNNGGGMIASTPPGQMGGTYRTLCVRTCDGYYFPISYATTPERFRDDEQACMRSCPAAEVQLFTYHNPGEDVNQAVSMNGAPYSALPNAFAYRKAMAPACGCRAPGQSWADALKAVGPDQTVAPGDIVVNEQNAKKLSAPPQARGAQPARGQPQSRTPTTAPAAADASPDAPTDPANRSMRAVGPAYVPGGR